MNVKTKIETLKIVLIHPLNNNYPISTILFGRTEISY